MKHLITLLFVIFHFAVFAQEEFPMSFGGDTVTMKKYYFCMLKAGDEAKNIDSVSLAKIQAAHLEHLGELYKQGKASIIGPMGDDGDWRGILILNASSEKEAEAMIAADPSVKAKRVKYEIHPWYGVKGASLK